MAKKFDNIPEEYRHCSYCSCYWTDGRNSYCNNTASRLNGKRKNICKSFVLDTRYI